MNTHKVNRMLRRLTKAAGLPVTGEFDPIRDMTATAMGAENVLAIKWIMGHSTGDLDRYAFRDPKEVRSALEKARKTILGTGKTSRRR